MNDETLEERFTFRLSRLNVFIALGTLTILLIFLTTILIAFTPLREYIPGYTNVGLQKKVYELQLKSDSIEKDIARKDAYIKNIKNIVSGGDLSEKIPVPADESGKFKDIRLKHSPEDSMLRVEVENQEKYSLYHMESEADQMQRKSSLGSVLFFTPIKGVVTSEFNPVERHYGIDIVAKKDEAIKSVLDGTVIFSNWTLETGYVIGIQHVQDIVSVYKHNAALLKKIGDMVKAGEPVAIIGETGETATGPHVHFELWSHGIPVNPKDYIAF